MRLPLIAVLLATPAAAQDPPPSPHWSVELDATEWFDNQQRTAAGSVHTYHFAHFTLLLDLESPLPTDDHLRISSRRPTIIGLAGRLEGGRDATSRDATANLTYTSTLVRNAIDLSFSYDGPDRYALTFNLGLETKGTNTACVRGTCAEAEVPQRAPFGWLVDAKLHPGEVRRDGDSWLITYARDEAMPRAGATRLHRELTIRLRPREATPPLVAKRATPR